MAKTNRAASVGGATFEMSCTVATDNLGEAGYSVLIQSQESLQSNVRTIMTLSPDNVLQHGGATDPSRRYCTKSPAPFFIYTLSAKIMCAHIRKRKTCNIFQYLIYEASQD